MLMPNYESLHTTVPKANSARYCVCTTFIIAVAQASLVEVESWTKKRREHRSPPILALTRSLFHMHKLLQVP